MMGERQNRLNGRWGLEQELTERTEGWEEGC